jgi:hypothetical protein
MFLALGVARQTARFGALEAAGGAPVGHGWLSGFFFERCMFMHLKDGLRLNVAVAWVE